MRELAGRTVRGAGAAARVMRGIRILVCDQKPVVRAGLRTLVAREPDIVVVGEATNCREALVALRGLTPDVALIDLGLPACQGVHLLQLLRLAVTNGRTRMIVLAPEGREEDAIEALRAGARGLLLQRATSDQLVRAIQVAASGDAVITPSVAGRLLDWISRRLPTSTPSSKAELDQLTRRERQVLELVARGWSTQRIAWALELRQVTVRSHLHHVLAKLGLRDRAEAVVFAYESGLVAPGGIGELFGNQRMAER